MRCTKFWDQHIHHYSLLPPTPPTTMLISTFSITLTAVDAHWHASGSTLRANQIEINTCAAASCTAPRVCHLQQGEAEASSSVLIQTQDLIAVAAEGMRELHVTRCKSPATASHAAGLLLTALQLTSKCCEGARDGWRAVQRRARPAGAGMTPRWRAAAVAGGAADCTPPNTTL
jgi:hypothetical protein